MASTQRVVYLRVALTAIVFMFGACWYFPCVCGQLWLPVCSDSQNPPPRRGTCSSIVPVKVHHTQAGAALALPSLSLDLPLKYACMAVFLHGPRPSGVANKCWPPPEPGDGGCSTHRLHAACGADQGPASGGDISLWLDVCCAAEEIACWELV